MWGENRLQIVGCDAEAAVPYNGIILCSVGPFYQSIYQRPFFAVKSDRYLFDWVFDRMKLSTTVNFVKIYPDTSSVVVPMSIVIFYCKGSQILKLTMNFAALLKMACKVFALYRGLVYIFCVGVVTSTSHD